MQRRRRGRHRPVRSRQPWPLVSGNRFSASVELLESGQIGCGGADHFTIARAAVNADNLGGRVYTRLLFPTMTPDAKMPYVCVPVQQETETLEYEGLGFISTWRLVGYAFFQDNPESDVLNSAGGIAASDFRDDLIKAFMADQYLSGMTENCEVISVETVPGSSDDNATWLLFTLEFTQHAGAGDLGIA